jgi:FMN phosphatase YigB (HAD superfamily)
MDVGGSCARRTLLLLFGGHLTRGSMTALVLDAMGVIYSVGDDVADLLCPFIEEKGGLLDRGRIEALYHEASLGRMSAEAFWRAVDIDPTLEDEYLQRHTLSHGLLQFLEATKPEVASLWCLSNDVSEWSRKLRERFGLTGLIDGFLISGDVGTRKPDTRIFHHLQQA